MTGIPALQKAINLVGGQVALAAKLGIRQNAVSNWIHKTKRIPAERVLAIEAITGVSRHDLRPDLYPRERRSVARASA
jgi:DNA-binding transcriptional regulator YdaS (Cro superfamily)